MGSLRFRARDTRTGTISSDIHAAGTLTLSELTFTEITIMNATHIQAHGTLPLSHAFVAFRVH